MTDHRHAHGLHARGEFFQARGFLNARRAPGGPEIQHHYLLLVICQRERSLVKSGKRKVRRGLANFDSGLGVPPVAEVEGHRACNEQ